MFFLLFFRYLSFSLRNIVFHYKILFRFFFLFTKNLLIESIVQSLSAVFCIASFVFPMRTNEREKEKNQIELNERKKKVIDAYYFPLSREEISFDSFRLA